jgi:cytochrome b pre-mRNA-processing protein 3
MFSWFDPHRDDRRKAGEIYGVVVTAARKPELFAEFAVPDTIPGRYEMVALHTFLALERLSSADVGGDLMTRLVVERFVVDMDDCFRELGFGDTSVPKNVKKAAGGLYERSTLYRAALAETSDDELQTALLHYVYGGSTAKPEAWQQPDPVATAGLARYMRRQTAVLAAIPAEQVMRGVMAFDARAA